MATTQDVREEVRRRYAAVALEGSSCCGGPAPEDERSKKIGYTEEELQAVPEGANLGLGCGNPLALAALREGDTVLDLGSGAGLDCFLAAPRVGAGGKVIGVDMTPQMLARARANAEKQGVENVEFRLGEIEALPVPDASVDVVISNCVINLSPDKDRVFAEMYRVLKPEGRFFVSDIVLLKPLPAAVMESAVAYSACVSGAVRKEKYLETIRLAGFAEVQVKEETTFPIEVILDDPNMKALFEGDGSVVTEEEVRQGLNILASIKVEGTKLAAPDCCG